MIDGLSLLVGLFIGWATMWAFDYWFYGQRTRSATAELRTLREQRESQEEEQRELTSRLSYLEEKREEMEGELVKRRADAKEAAARAAELEEELTTARNNLSVAKNEVDDLRAQLKVANIRAGEPVEVIAKSVTETATVETPAAPTKKDDLKLINGIGPVYEQRLNAAGINNFAQLQAQDPQRVHAIINPKDWQQIDPEAWVEEAGLFATQPLLQTDELLQVKGIGPKYAQLLHEGGINSLADLAQRSGGEVEEILGDELVAGADPAAWVAQAQTLSA